MWSWKKSIEPSPETPWMRRRRRFGLAGVEDDNGGGGAHIEGKRGTGGGVPIHGLVGGADEPSVVGAIGITVAHLHIVGQAPGIPGDLLVVDGEIIPAGGDAARVVAGRVGLRIPVVIGVGSIELEAPVPGGQGGAQLAAGEARDDRAMGI